MVYNEIEDIYEGGWVKDLKEGEGIYEFKNGDKFIGKQIIFFNFSSNKYKKPLKYFNFLSKILKCAFQIIYFHFILK